jgi:HNH endonuclease
MSAANSSIISARSLPIRMVVASVMVRFCLSSRSARPSASLFFEDRLPFTKKCRNGFSRVLDCDPLVATIYLAPFVGLSRFHASAGIIPPTRLVVVPVNLVPPCRISWSPSPHIRLEQEPNRKASTVMVRMGQQRFRFHVMSQYGHKCAVCGIRHPQLLKAAHIRGMAKRGTDDWRNGIPLCATHHDAFDCYLFGIDPESHAIRCMPGVNEKDVGLLEARLRPLKNAPHLEALQWRWRETLREWKDSPHEARRSPL